MHHKRKRPRVLSRGRSRFPDGSPAYWNIQHHSRPRRRRDELRLKAILRGADADAVSWELGNHKPHVYYW